MLLCHDWLSGQRVNADIRVLGGFAKTCQDFAFYQVDSTLYVNAFAFYQVDLTLHLNALADALHRFGRGVHQPIRYRDETRLLPYLEHCYY